MADPLTVGELRAIWAVIETHGPPDSRDRLAQRLTEQLPRFVTHHIACTDGCQEPELCDQCPCHTQEETSI